MALRWELADRTRDDAEYADFACWDGRPGRPWIEEVENYVRGWVLRDARHVLSFRTDGGQLAAVAAFNEHVVQVPLVEPVDHPAWLLTVVAVHLDHQRNGLSGEVFAGVFEAMRRFDPARVLIAGRVHRRHRASVSACKKVELRPWRSIDEHYVELLGEVPPA